MLNNLSLFLRKNKDFWVFLVLFFLTLFTCRFLFASNYFYAHDLDYNLARGLEAFQMLKSGHFPLRWASGLNNGCGVPIFNFFYPLGYYLLALLYFLLDDIFLSWKILIFFSLFSGSWFFYLWAKNVTQDKLSSFVGSFLYLFAPYRFLLVFVRGSLEFLSYAIFPVVLFFLSCFLKEKSSKKKLLYLFAFTIFGSLFILSHNIVVMLVFPLLVLVSFASLLKVRNSGKKDFVALSFSFLSMLGLSSFFVGPALLERSYVRLGVSNIVDYRDHFPSLFQIFRSPWGYFFSVKGNNDGMSFMLGYSQWLVLFASLFLIFYLFKKRNKRYSSFWYNHFWLFFYFSLSILSLFLLLPYSGFVWEEIKVLQEVQYPWRILGVSVFLVSSLSVYTLSSLREKKRVYLLLAFLLVFLGVVGNRNHLRVLNINQDRKLWFEDFSYPNFVGTTTIADEISSNGSKSLCNLGEKFVSGSFSNFDLVSRNSTSGTVKLTLNKNMKDDVIFALEYFPLAYEFNINGKDKVPYKNCNGRVCIDASEFRDYNLISWRIVQTPIQKFFNLLSLSFFVLWFFIILASYTNKKIVFISLFLLVFLFLRSYNLDTRLLFGWDQERDAFFVRDIIGGKLTLIGPRVVGRDGFFLPPYFFYLLSPFYFLFKLNSLPSLVAFLFFYWVLFFVISMISLSKIFDNKVPFWFILVWSFLPGAIAIDRVPWNPLLVPLIFFLLLFLYHLYFKTRKLIIFFFLSLIYFLGISFHIESTFYLPFIVLALFRGGKNCLSKKMLLLFLSFILVFSPIFIFDVRHNFLNLNLILNFGNSAIQEGGLIEVWQNFLSIVFGFGFSKTVSFVFYLLVLFVSFKFYFYEKDNLKKNILFILFSILVLSLFVFLFVYHFRPSEYYFNFSLPIFVLLFSFWFDRFFSTFKLRIIPVFLAILILLLKFSLPLYNSDNESIFYKEKVISSLKAVFENRNYDISLDIAEGKDAGFYYLLSFNNIGYNKKDGSPLIQIVSPSRQNCPINIKAYSLCFNPLDFGW